MSVFGGKSKAENNRDFSQEKRHIALEKIEDMVTFHGEVFPDNPNRMFESGKFIEVPEPNRDIDVAIIGGGAGGLTAAFRLKDLNTVLFEALPEVGGNSMYYEWEGMPFSLGGLFFGPRGTLSDSVWDLCRELNLLPEKDTSPLIAALRGNVQVENFNKALGFIRIPLPWRVKRDMIRFYFLDMPRIDAEARKEKLDKILFSEFMKKYSPEFRDWYDHLAKPYPRADDVSAYYAISSVRDYSDEEGVYSFPGGLGLINRTLAEKIQETESGRILTGAFVYKVRHDADGRVLVTYWHNGKVRSIRAKAAIINAEANIAKEILEDIPYELKDAMGQMRRYSNTVFHFCSRKSIYRRGYRNAIMNSDMQYVAVQDWFNRSKGANRPNILTCSNKMTLADVDLPKDRNAMIRMAAQVMSELDAHFPGAIEKTAAVHVFLRTRNRCIAYPGYLTDVFPKLGKPYGNIFFANAEYIQPDTGFPEAVIAGNQAAQKVRKLIP